MFCSKCTWDEHGFPARGGILCTARSAGDVGQLCLLPEDVAPHPRAVQQELGSFGYGEMLQGPQGENNPTICRL